MSHQSKFQASLLIAACALPFMRCSTTQIVRNDGDATGAGGASGETGSGGDDAGVGGSSGNRSGGSAGDDGMASGGEGGSGGAVHSAGAAGLGGDEGSSGRCAPNPCQNGGECMNTLGDFTCRCDTSHTGKTCELLRFETLDLTTAEMPQVFGTIAKVSADGTVIATNVTIADEQGAGGAGAVPESHTRAMRWSREEGVVLLEPPPGFLDSSANAISADGRVVVGTASDAASTMAVRWVLHGDAEELGVLPDDDSSTARVVNRDGSVIAGVSVVTDEIHTFRWIEGSGLEGLAGVAEGLNAIPTGIAEPAGTFVIVGSLTTTDDGTPRSGFFWPEVASASELGAAAGDTGAAVNGVNSDGTVIVGATVASDGSRRAARWAGAGSVPDVLAPSSSAAMSVSDDGARIYLLVNPADGPFGVPWGNPAILSEGSGQVNLDVLESKFACGVSLARAPASGTPFAGFCAGPPEATLWDAEGDVSLLFDDVVEWGFEVSEFSPPFFVDGVSSDGKTIVGSANRVGGRDIWIARLP
jgi:hypothetical protein